MRRKVDKARLQEFMRRLAESSKGPGHVFLAGGATMLLLGIREQTIDVDIKLDPEPKGVFEAIAGLKEELDINVELASPDDFLPPLPGWREKSLPIMTHSGVVFHHYDLRAQALAKLERGHAQDIEDVRALVSRKLVQPAELSFGLEAIDRELIRYPAVDAAALKQKVADFIASVAS